MEKTDFSSLYNHNSCFIKHINNLIWQNIVWNVVFKISSNWKGYFNKFNLNESIFYHSLFSQKSPKIVPPYRSDTTAELINPTFLTSKGFGHIPWTHTCKTGCNPFLPRASSKLSISCLLGTMTKKYIFSSLEESRKKNAYFLFHFMDYEIFLYVYCDTKVLKYGNLC